VLSLLAMSFMIKGSKRGRRLVFSLVGVVAVAGVVAAVMLLTGEKQPPVGTIVGQTAPDFTLEDPQGKSVSLSSLRGQVVMLQFWQTGCADCRREMPYLADLHRRYKDRGLVWMGVNLDRSGDVALDYLEESGLADGQLMLGNDYDKAMGIVDLYKVELVPCVFVIDKLGIIRFRGVFPQKPYAGDIEPWL
jgi:peroxiredoxin